MFRIFLTLVSCLEKIGKRAMEVVAQFLVQSSRAHRLVLRSF